MPKRSRQPETLEEVPVAEYTAAGRQVGAGDDADSDSGQSRTSPSSESASENGDALAIKGMKQRKQDADDQRKAAQKEKHRKTKKAAPQEFASSISAVLSKGGPSTEKGTRNPSVVPDELHGATVSAAARTADAVLARLEQSRRARKAAGAADRLKLKENRLERKAVRSKGHVFPVEDPTFFGDEKSFRKIATKGVVKLFNAVATAQAVAEAEGSSLGATAIKSRSDRAKSAFADSVTQRDGARPTSSEKGWDVLKDSFMSRKLKMKDWGREDDGDSGASGPEESLSSADSDG